MCVRIWAHKSRITVRPTTWRLPLQFFRHVHIPLCTLDLGHGTKICIHGYKPMQSPARTVRTELINFTGVVHCLATSTSFCACGIYIYMHEHTHMYILHLFSAVFGGVRAKQHHIFPFAPVMCACICVSTPSFCWTHYTACRPCFFSARYKEPCWSMPLVWVTRNYNLWETAMLRMPF